MKTLSVELIWNGGWFDMRADWMLCDKRIGGLFPQLWDTHKGSQIRLTLHDKGVNGSMSLIVRHSRESGLAWKRPDSGSQWQVFTRAFDRFMFRFGEFSAEPRTIFVSIERLT